MKTTLAALLLLVGVTLCHGSFAPMPNFTMIPDVVGDDYSGIDTFQVSIASDIEITTMTLGLDILEGGTFDETSIPDDFGNFEFFKAEFDKDDYELKLTAEEDLGILPPAIGVIVSNIKFDLDVTGNPFTINLYDLKNYDQPELMDTLAYVPEPMTLSLLALGGLVLSRRS